MVFVKAFVIKKGVEVLTEWEAVMKFKETRIKTKEIKQFKALQKWEIEE